MKSFFSCIVLLSLLTFKDKPPEPSDGGAALPVARNLFVITIDGVRWQEIFTGADTSLLHDERFTSDTASFSLLYGASLSSERRKQLLPFFWNVIANKGQLFGNRGYDSRMNVANAYALSYPGYNEIFTGNTDIAVASNQKKINRNSNVLDYLNSLDAFTGRVAAFTSWDVFPYILHRTSNGIVINSGYGDSLQCALNADQVLIKKVETDAVQEKAATRHDLLTFLTAKEYLQQHKPRVFFLGLGETDEAAHAGHYDTYLEKLSGADAMIASLWHWVQSTPGYKDNTTFLITTDHGRGETAAKWTTHGMFVKGSSQTWMAVLGPGIAARGEIKEAQQLYQKQLAQTIAGLVGEEFNAPAPVAANVSIR